MEIHEAIIRIMAESDAITKGRKNQQQGYNFRGIDDVYNSLHPLFSKHGVFSVPEVLEERTEDRTTKAGSALIYRVLRIRYTFYAKDGSSVQATVVGEGMDSGDKASNKAMAVGHKYAILQMLSIPTEEPKDPENESHDIVPRQVPRQDEGKMLEARRIADRLALSQAERKQMFTDYHNDIDEVLIVLREKARQLEASFAGGAK